MCDLYEKILDIFLTAALIGYLVFICGIVTGFVLVFIIGIPVEVITFPHILGFAFCTSLLIGLTQLVIRLNK